MVTNFKLEKSNRSDQENDTLHIKSSARGGSVRGYINIIKFQDRDTKQWVYYVPSLEISGYGENAEKAFLMLRESIDDFFGNLVMLPKDKLKEELAHWGWRRNKLRTKDYSRAYVDSDGDLKNFNADNVERLTLVA